MIYQFSDEFRQAYESMTIPIVIDQFIDGKVVPLLVSDGFCRLTGLDREKALSLMGEGQYYLVHPDDAGKVLLASDDFARRRTPHYDQLIRARHEDGYHLIHVIGRWQTMPDETEVAFMVYTDVTSSKEAIGKLRSSGIHKTVMLTGDASKVAEGVAANLGIDEVVSELLPADKVGEVERIIKENEGGKVAFVGDGINDAPVLTRADIGIAMGAMGSDAAIEAADVVLMDDDPVKISKAIRISRKCLRIVYENITFALVIKFACLVLGALGIANMWLAIFADVGVMIIAVLNAIRALRVHKL